MSEAELREKLHSALFADDFPILNDIEKDAVDRIVAIIQAHKPDRKRVALEARIDEVANFMSTMVTTHGDIPARSVSTAKIRQRIAELKAQQESKDDTK